MKEIIVARARIDLYNVLNGNAASLYTRGGVVSHTASLRAHVMGVAISGDMGNVSRISQDCHGR